MNASDSLPDFTPAFADPVSTHGQIHSYAELQQKIHEDLRAQHPEWVQPDGACPTCESYERKLAELLGLSQSAQRNLVAA